MKALITAVTPVRANMLNEVIHVKCSLITMPGTKISINIVITVLIMQRNTTNEGELGLEYNLSFESKTFSIISFPSLPISH